MPGSRLKELVPYDLRRAVKVGRSRVHERRGNYSFCDTTLNGIGAGLAKHIRHDGGVFLEIGANDGFSQSNTYYLERVRGWRGILIEPSRDLFAHCQRLRPTADCFNVACVAPEGPAFVTLARRNLMTVALGLQDAKEESTRLEEEYTSERVATATLSQVIDASAHTAVDFMSVDVEGAEEQVLLGLDLARHTPQLLLVETKHPEVISDLLGNHMTLVTNLTHHDYLFERAGR